ncbi:hypothetical protein OJ940_RS01265 [Staphylococcus pseudintermedius]|nr:hypothetical protein [Staphylococcus pseudintermedius]
MKIKKKVKMNLHELIQWAWENDVKGKTFKSNRGKKVKFYSIGGFNVLEPIWGHDTFTVEVEELITEKTIIPNLLEAYEYDSTLVFEVRKNKSIKDLLDSDDYDGVTIKAFHIINDDSTHTLVWKDGGLV